MGRLYLLGSVLVITIMGLLIVVCAYAPVMHGGLMATAQRAMHTLAPAHTQDGKLAPFYVLADGMWHCVCLRLYCSSLVPARPDLVDGRTVFWLSLDVHPGCRQEAPLLRAGCPCVTYLAS